MADIEIEDFDVEGLKLLVDQLNAENETISFLLKAHLLSEYYIDKLLSVYLGKNKHPIDRLELGYAKKLALVKSFHLLQEDCIASLAALNILCNRCVHNFNTTPSLMDMQEVTGKFLNFLPRGDKIENVVDLIKAYMFFLAGRFSGAYRVVRDGLAKA
jgi:hypothetical protein